MPTLNVISLKNRLLQDDALVVMVLEQYSRDLPDQLEKLGDAFTAGDMREVARLAHKIRGSSGNVGAEMLQQLAAETEQAALQENRRVVGKGLAAIGSHFPELKKQVEAYLLHCSSSRS